MTPINFHKKEKPLTSLASMGGGAAGMANAGLAEKIYLDDIFSTYLYKGNESTKTVTTGIDLTTDGGMVWGKSRGGAHAPFFYDTERGVEKYIRSDTWAGEVNLSTGLTAFTSTGFTLGSHVGMNDDVKNAVWSFKKTPGFFDVIKYTGNGVRGRQIAHSLGCKPGLIIIKFLGGNQNWCVYHSSVGASMYCTLDTVSAFGAATLTRWNDTEPTATHFTVGEDNEVNGSGGSEYIAYLFAGGPSSAATARSVELDGNDYLVVPDSSNNDFYFGTDDFTVEGWVYPQSYGEIIGAFHPTGSNYGWLVSLDFGCSAGKLSFYQHSAGSGAITNCGTVTVPKEQWSHFAVTRSGNTFRIFLNGAQEKQWTQTAEVGDPDTSIYVGADTNPSPGRIMSGKVSNIRVVKGTAVYTSSFKAPTEPLTNITNTKLLCCQSSTVTTATVTPGTITTVGNPAASTDSPFLDPQGFKFGEESDQNIVKCGKYQGNGIANSIHVDCGWEPQWLLIKKATGQENWLMLDCMRGLSNRGGNVGDKYLTANQATVEAEYDFVSLTPTGFTLTVVEGHTNSSGADYVYMAIRRPDPYVSKPAEAGTDVFAMDTGTAGGEYPCFDSGFAVDFALSRRPASSEEWYTTARLIEQRVLNTNNTNAAANNSFFPYDNSVGYGTNLGNTYQSWMWKRHAGFDVVTYKSGQPNITQFRHNLKQVPEMMWVKRRDGSGSWQVYHKGYNGGVNPENYFLELNRGYAQDNGDRWNNTAPTSTYFSLGAVDTVNGAASNNYEYIALLFASVNGISKVGSYTGNSTAGHAITTGFQPRFLIIKSLTQTYDWYVVDTTRGWAAGDDKILKLNDSGAQAQWGFGNPTATGFELNNDGAINGNGEKYIYYAHA